MLFIVKCTHVCIRCNTDLCWCSRFHQLMRTMQIFWMRSMISLWSPGEKDKQTHCLRIFHIKGKNNISWLRSVILCGLRKEKQIRHPESWFSWFTWIPSFSVDSVEIGINYKVLTSSFTSSHFNPSPLWAGSHQHFSLWNIFIPHHVKLVQSKSIKPGTCSWSS